MNTRTRIGGGFFRSVPLGDDEIIIKETPAQCVRSIFSSWVGLLYLTNKRILWTPLAIPLAYKTVLVEKSQSLKAIGPTSILDKISGHMWRLETPGGAHAFMFFWSPSRPRRTRQWVDAINEWASS